MQELYIFSNIVNFRIQIRSQIEMLESDCRIKEKRKRVKKSTQTTQKHWTRILDLTTIVVELKWFERALGLWQYDCSIFNPIFICISKQIYGIDKLRYLAKCLNSAHLALKITPLFTPEYDTMLSKVIFNYDFWIC